MKLYLIILLFAANSLSYYANETDDEDSIEETDENENRLANGFLSSVVTSLKDLNIEEVLPDDFLGTRHKRRKISSDMSYVNDGETSGTSMNEDLVMNPRDIDMIPADKDQDFPELKLQNDDKKVNGSRKRKLGFVQINNSPDDESVLYYLLSRFCYEKRMQKTDLIQNYLTSKILNKEPETEEFKTKVGLEKDFFKNKRQYFLISDYFNTKCPSNITEEEAKSNILFWENKVKTRKDFRNLKKIGNELSPSTSKL